MRTRNVKPETSAYLHDINLLLSIDESPELWAGLLPDPLAR
jgi:hypothetical protein